jgi:tol-pal system beta propeller repeat protein TolB
MGCSLFPTLLRHSKTTPSPEPNWALTPAILPTSTLIPTQKALPQGTDGSYKIAFSTLRDTEKFGGEIYIMDADGGNLVRFSNLPDHDDYPAWSPDGSKIAFVSAGRYFHFYVMNLDGSNLLELVEPNNPIVQDFSWSPDGTKIAFTGGEINEIYLINSDGSNQTKITNKFSSISYLRWSPDGTKLAFVSDQDGNNEIYVMNPDGTDEKRLTNQPGMETSLAWSPDGKKIAFVSDRDGTYDIFVMNSDGTQQNNLTNNSGVDFSPAWSPDGARIAFSSRFSYRQIFVMDSDGGNRVNISRNSYNDEYPAWSPDGEKIAFRSDRDGSFDIFVMDPNGNNQINLTNHPSDDIWFSWSPP